MERFMTRTKKIIDWMTRNRNILYLSSCLGIHAAYLYFFYNLDIWVLALLNLISCSFYLYNLFLKKDTSEKSIAATYFEILFFSFFSELVLGPSYGFFLYIIGMISAVFYLIPSYGNKRFLFQVIGIVEAFLIEGIVTVAGVSFPTIQTRTEPYQGKIYLINLAITAVIILSATFFYSHETDMVWQTLNYNMNHDVLTGLYNRRFFEKHMELISDSERSQFVISMIDIDNFKKVNDTYGHEAGDAVLVEVSSCLKDAAGKDNLAVRWGGEEFIIYFPGATPEKIQFVMEQVRKKIEGTVIRTVGKEIQVTITTGIATGLADSNYEKVIRNADEKLYLGKNSGKNCIIV